MNLADYLALPFAQHALISGTLIALICGVLSPFVLMRQMAFAVHGAAELSFTGAAVGLVLIGDPVVGALCGSVVVAGLIGSLGDRPRERDSAIGVVLAGGLGLGILLLSQYQGFASAATSILFGDIFSIAAGQIWLLLVLGGVVLVALGFLYRPLLFASVDPELAQASGVPTRLLGIVFLVLLAVTVTEAAQVVGTLLVLSLAIIPGAAAQRVASGPLATTAVSVAIALCATDGGLLLALNGTTVPPTVFVTAISVGLYVVARLIGPRLIAAKGRALHEARIVS